MKIVEGTEGAVFQGYALPKPSNAEHDPAIDRIQELGCAQAHIIWQINKTLYDTAQVLAQGSEGGRAFTDHNRDHIMMVADKTNEASDIFGRTQGTIGEHFYRINHIAFRRNIEKSTLLGAALSHDTGMAGNGYAIQCHKKAGHKIYIRDGNGKYIIHVVDTSNFDEVRDNHSLNSALHILKNRGAFKDAGYTDLQIDRIAAECMAHSKSSSGVLDLNSIPDWTDCFDRIGAAVDAYNMDHPNAALSFDRKRFECDEEQMGVLAAETFSLRIGDVSRDSGPDAKSQSGEVVHVVRETLKDTAGIWSRELDGAVITIGKNKDPITNLKSRQVHAGEQNIISNRCCIGKSGRFTHRITVVNGVSAPKCTQESIGDHLGELASAKDEQFDVVVVFQHDCDSFAKESYEQFRDEAANKYGNVDIHYPWDEEDLHGTN